MTQLEYAKKNIVTPLMKQIAHEEGINIGDFLRYIKEGRIVILNNNSRKIKKPCAVGYSLRTKVNSNIGTSTDISEIKEELKKLSISINSGADTVMDLSVGGNLSQIRKLIIKNSTIPIGTVPIYELAVNAQSKNNNFLDFSATDMLGVL